MRNGLYVREAGVWITFLVFKGTDLHSGYAPSEDKEAHQAWIDSELLPAWNRAGDQNRVAFVCYPASQAVNRSAAMNMTPAQTFGNFGAAQPHKTNQHTFSNDGKVALGATEDWANRLGREMVFSFWNQLQYCNLDLGLRPNDLLQNISFLNATGEQVTLKPFAYDPVSDFEKIKLWNGYYAWYEIQCESVAIPMTKHQFKNRRRVRNAIFDKEKTSTVFDTAEKRSLTFNTPRATDAGPSMRVEGASLNEETPLFFQVEEVLARKVGDNQKVIFLVRSTFS